MDAPDSLRSPENGDRDHGRADGFRRTVIYPIRLTEAERDRLRGLARERGLSVARYIRAAALGGSHPPRRRTSTTVPAINRDTYRHLGQVGNNLNQIARRFNIADGDDPTSDEVLEVLAELVAVVRSLQLQVLGGAEP